MDNLIKEYEIGRGILTWDSEERRSDRYGFIQLTNSNSKDEVFEDPVYIDHGLISQIIGQHGRLVAEILKNRKSTHIGDLTHEVYPTIPEVGEVIELGEGTLIYQPPMVGLMPNDGRDNIWLNINSLYRAHEQTVSLKFIPDNFEKRN